MNRWRSLIIKWQGQAEEFTDEGLPPHWVWVYCVIYAISILLRFEKSIHKTESFFEKFILGLILILHWEQILIFNSGNNTDQLYLYRDMCLKLVINFKKSIHKTKSFFKDTCYTWLKNE